MELAPSVHKSCQIDAKAADLLSALLTYHFVLLLFNAFRPIFSCDNYYIYIYNYIYDYIKV